MKKGKVTRLDTFLSKITIFFITIRKYTKEESWYRERLYYNFTLIKIYKLK